MFNQITFQLLMHILITKLISHAHHILEIWRHTCRILFSMSLYIFN
ncbi:unnamed protein product [Arabidopsis halleri]